MSVNTKLKTVQIEKVSTDGILRNALFENVVDCWFDEKFSFRGAVITPAVRLLLHSSREYAVIGLYAPEVVCRVIKSSKSISLSYEDFDPPLIRDVEAYLKLSENRYSWREIQNRTKYWNNFVQEVPNYREAGSELLCARSLWAPKLPKGVQKLQFFKYLQYVDP